MSALREVLRTYRDRTPVFVMHAGSGNHGCEAIAASLLSLWEDCREASNHSDNEPVLPVLVTNAAAEDMHYALGERVQKKSLVLIEERHMERHFVWHVLYYLWRKLTGDRESFLRFRFRPLLRYLRSAGISPDETVLYCIGGDNYCYPEMVPDLILANRMFAKKGFESVLIGCSIEPDSLQGELPDDLKGYARIVARESITYEGLLSAGIEKEKLTLDLDPAFWLKAGHTEAKGIIPRRTVGINVSPMAIAGEKKKGITMESVQALIRHILTTSNAQVMLIPHVVWDNNDDRKVLKELYRTFEETGRVSLAGDMSAQDLKYVIGQCSLFIGARTHATIAAYSQGVPTLVLGYSVKSRGIAKDLFAGTAVADAKPKLPAPFVLPVQSLEKPQELIDAYDALLKNAAQVADILHRRMKEAGIT